MAVEEAAEAEADDDNDRDVFGEKRTLMLFLSLSNSSVTRRSHLPLQYLALRSATTERGGGGGVVRASCTVTVDDNPV